MSNKNIQPKNAIIVEDVSKLFTVPHERMYTLRSAFVNLFKPKKYDVLKALDHVSFEITKGECFGIIGRNGSGKSTLLKILAGVYVPTSGNVKLNDSIAPFLELGIGFNPELSGRDNVYLNAAVLGMPHDVIESKFKEIVAFAELERFIDQKLKNYSSGMKVRLAFAVSIHANKEILLMDEVLAVGDLAFQEKCMKEFDRYRAEGKTVVLVTHDLGVVEKYCDRALYLKDGKVVASGNVHEVAHKYRLQAMEDVDLIDK